MTSCLLLTIGIACFGEQIGSDFEDIELVIGFIKGIATPFITLTGVI